MSFPQIDTNEVIPETWQELTTDHEVADTILLLHAKRALTVFPSIIIKTPDTDVFFFFLVLLNSLN